jgi:hypothetical protein
LFRFRSQWIGSASIHWVGQKLFIGGNHQNLQSGDWNLVAGLHDGVFAGGSGFETVKPLLILLLDIVAMGIEPADWD